MERRKVIMVLLAFLFIYSPHAYSTVEEEWKTARTFDTAEAYSTFLEKHPNDKFSKEAKLALETLPGSR